MHLKKSLVGLAAIPLAYAQTSTDCNPLDKTCPADTGLDATTFSTDFTKGASANTSWSAATGTTITYGDKGAIFTISEEGQAPTIETDFYFFFGTVEVVMQAAAGTGIVSSIVLESDDLDEIDWEFLGGDTTQAETNYFGKGNTTTYDRAIYYPVTSPQTTMHTYLIDWSESAIVFSIDGTVVRTLNYADCNGGDNFPQTPMRLKLGNWAGGASTEPAGTVEWAGGATDFSDGPFIMYVESVKVTNSNPGVSYTYGDETGSYDSIVVKKGSGSSASSSAASASSSSASTSTAPASSSSAKASSTTSTASKASTVKIANAAQTDVTVSVSSTKSITTTAKLSTTTTKAKATAAAYANSTSTSNSTSSNATSTAGVAQQTTSGASTLARAASLALSILAMGLCFTVL